MVWFALLFYVISTNRQMLLLFGMKSFVILRRYSVRIQSVQKKHKKLSDALQIAVHVSKLAATRSLVSC